MDRLSDHKGDPRQTAPQQEPPSRGAADQTPLPAQRVMRKLSGDLSRTSDVENHVQDLKFENHVSGSGPSRRTKPLDVETPTNPIKNLPIHYASAIEYLAMVQENHVSGSGPSRRTMRPMVPDTPASSNKNQPIHYAAAIGNLAMIQLELQRSPTSVGLRAANGRTPLSLVAKGGHVQVARLLLASGADPDAHDDLEHTPLWYAADGLHCEIVQLLINAHANVEIADKTTGNRPLHIMARRGLANMVRLLLGNQADVNSRGAGGRTPLLFAAQYNHPETIGVLLQQGANVNIQDGNGSTALRIASRKGHSEIVRALLDAGANVDIQDKQSLTALHSASKMGRVELVKALLKGGANVHYQDRIGWTALHVAAYKGYGKVAKLLLEHGARVNRQSNDGATALYAASQEGHAEVVKLLLDSGADLAIGVNSVHWRPISRAAKTGHLDVVKLLLAKNPGDVNVEDAKGRTPLYLAMSGDKPEQLEVAEYLLENGAR